MDQRAHAPAGPTSSLCQIIARILLVILFPRHILVVTMSDFNTPGPPMTVSARHSGQHFEDDQQYPPVKCTPVAYLRYADKYFGPCASRLREVYQPVLMTRNRFSRPCLHLLVCIWAHRAAPHPDLQPASYFRPSVGWTQQRYV